MTFFSKIIQSFGAQLVTLVCGLASSVITARCLGPEGRGELAVLQNVVFMSTFFGNLGVHAALVYFVARDKQAKADEVFSTAIILVSLSGLLLTVGTLLFGSTATAVFQGVPLVLIGVASLQILPTLFLYIGQHLMLARDRIGMMNTYLLSYAVLNLVLALGVFVVFHGGLWEYVICQTVMLILITGFQAYVLHARGLMSFRMAFSRSVALDLLRYGFVSFLAGLISVLVARSNVFFVNQMLGTGATGNFAVASRFGDLVTMLPTTVGLLLMPRISANQNDAHITPKVSRALTGVLLLVCLAGGGLMQWAVKILYGARFEEAVLPSVILLFANAFLSLELIYANYLMGKGYPNRLIYAWLPTLAVNIVLNLLLIPRLGLNGVALASLFSYIVLFVAVFEMARRMNRVPWKEYFVPTRSDWLALKGRLS